MVVLVLNDPCDQSVIDFNMGFKVRILVSNFYLWFPRHFFANVGDA